MFQSRVLIAVLAGLFFLPTGCAEPEPLRTYSVPVEAGPIIRQMEAAIVLVDDKAWFFKVMGVPEVVAQHRADLLVFLQSLEFGDEEPLNYQLPAGWQVIPPDPQVSTNPHSSTPPGMRPFAEIALATNSEHAAAPPPLKLVITRLDFSVPEAQEERKASQASYTLQNVNRWRRQVALPPLEAGDSGLQGESFQTKTGQDGNLYSMVGQVEAAGRRPPALKEFDVDTDNIKTPSGWTQAPNDQFSKLAFTTGDNSSIRITVTPVSGSADRTQVVQSNFGRWLGQLGLSDFPEGAFSEPQEVDGHATFVVNVASTGPVPQPNGELSAGPVRIVGAIIFAEGSIWTIRMKGPALPVQEEVSNFNVFLNSTKFKPLPRR
ncbi:MAG: hypothetical protein MPJ50_07985 [Pirellulales bacterium]|nr:hypothetical protein [Pirellulales bacterium]